MAADCMGMHAHPLCHFAAIFCMILVDLFLCAEAFCDACMGRLNWQLHFGEQPKWAAGVKFILVDVEPTERDAQKAELVLRGDAAAVAQQLTEDATSSNSWGEAAVSRHAQWRQQLAGKVGSRRCRGTSWQQQHDSLGLPSGHLLPWHPLSA